MGAVSSAIDMIRGGQLSRVLKLIKLRALNGKASYFYNAKVWSETPSALRKIYLTEVERTASAPVPPSVTTLLSTNRPHRVLPTLEMLARQRGVHLNVVIATHGFSATEYETLPLAQRLRVKWISASADLSLGEVYNQILALADTEYVAKIDDDDWYGDTYLAVSIAALKSSGAVITGKNAVFVYSDASDAVYIRMSHKHHRFVFSVSGGTILARTDAAKQLGFAPISVGEDQDFLTRAFDHGMQIYSSAPFGYVYRRCSDNTWNDTEIDFFSDATQIHTGAPGTFECVTG